MADLVLNGKEITFDWSKVKHKDCIQFYIDAMTAEEEDNFLQKVCGMKLDEINDMTQADWKKFALSMRKSYFAPIAETEKNSPSVSTSPESA